MATMAAKIFKTNASGAELTTKRSSIKPFGTINRKPGIEAMKITSMRAAAGYQAIRATRIQPMLEILLSEIYEFLVLI